MAGFEGNKSARDGHERFEGTSEKGGGKGKRNDGRKRGHKCHCKTLWPSTMKTKQKQKKKKKK
jgi:hypothetical protein